MLIVCPSCVSAYRMPPEALRSAARAVRCAQCGSVFEPTPAAHGAVDLALATEPAFPAGLISEPALRPVMALRESPQRSRGLVSRAVVAGAIAILGLNMAGIAFRARIAEMAPALAPVYAAIGLPAVPPGLTLVSIGTALADEAPGKVLTLEGTITNPGKAEAAVPNLRIVVRDAAEQTIYSWTTPAPRARLGPGEAVDFRSRLVSPPPTGHDIVVGFAGQADMAAPAKVTNGR